MIPAYQLRGAVIALLLMSIIMIAVGCSTTQYVHETPLGDKTSITHNELFKERRGLSVDLKDGKMSVESSRGQTLPIKEVTEILAR